MKCSDCGADNPSIAKFCMSCGRELESVASSEDSKKPSRSCVECGRSIGWDVNVCPHCGHSYVGSGPVIGPVSSPVMTSSKGQRSCVSCGRAVDWEVKFCPYCGHDFKGPATPKKKGEYAVAGGVLSIMAGVIGVLLGFIWVMAEVGNFDELVPVGQILFIFLCFSAVMAIAGGVCGISKRYFPIAVLGSVFAIVGLGFFLGIPALILTAISKHQFKDQK